MTDGLLIGLSINMIIGPDRRKLVATPYQIVPGVFHIVGLREVQSSRYRVPLWISADCYYSYLLGLRTESLQCCVQLLGCKRADVRAVGVQKCQNDRFSLQV